MSRTMQYILEQQEMGNDLLEMRAELARLQARLEKESRLDELANEKEADFYKDTTEGNDNE